MGKAARLRVQKQSQQRMGIARRSAYARIWRDMSTQRDYPSRDPMVNATADAALARLPHARVYLYSAWAAPDMPLAVLRNQLGDLRLPFEVTLLDAADHHLGDGWYLAGVLGFEKPKRALIFVCYRTDSSRWIAPLMVLEDIQEWEGDWLQTNDPDHGGGTYAPDFGERLARAAVTMLAMLECANVDILPALDPPRKGHVAHGIPHFDVIIRQARSQREPPEEHGSVDWSHRWEVAAHFKHFKRGPVFEANPDRRIQHSVHGECVRIWCPSFIKGPADKPLIPKVRIVAGGRG